MEIKKEILAGETVTRFAVLIRDINGQAELLASIHPTEADALLQGSYWQNIHYRGVPVKAEIVSFQVPTRGLPVPPAADRLPATGGPERLPADPTALFLNRRVERGHSE